MVILLIILLLILIILSLLFFCKDYFTNKKKSDIVLITEYYVNKDSVRDNEIKDSIYKNDSNNLIDKIYLLNENDKNKYESLTNSNKIINIPANKRSTFYDAFQLANTLPNGTIVIISNNDISFDETLQKLHKINLDNTIICLGRRDAHNDEYLEFWTTKGLSQDSWIFKTPIKIPENTDFYFGTTACDHHIAYLLNSVGYKLINIPLDIKAYHNHKSEVRKWIKKPDSFKKNFLNVPVTYLNLK